MTIKPEAKDLPQLHRGPEASATDWADPWTATEEARKKTFPRTLRDLEIVGRHITDEINMDPKEVAKLRRSIAQARAGDTTPWRKAGDDT